jgi:hypothetical protein
MTILSAFLSRFTLTESGFEALTSSNVPVGKRAFLAMIRTREDSRV